MCALAVEQDHGEGHRIWKTKDFADSSNHAFEPASLRPSATRAELNPGLQRRLQDTGRRRLRSRRGQRALFSGGFVEVLGCSPLELR